MAEDRCGSVLGDRSVLNGIGAVGSSGGLLAMPDMADALPSAVVSPAVAHSMAEHDETDTDTDSELPLPPSHEKARHAGGGEGGGQATRPPPGRVSGVDVGIGRGVVPRKTHVDSDDEDDYVRQVCGSFSHRQLPLHV